MASIRDRAMSSARPRPGHEDMTCRRVKTRSGVDEEQKPRDRTKSKVRAKVEWPFRVLKRVFGFTKVRIRA